MILYKWLKKMKDKQTFPAHLLRSVKSHNIFKKKYYKKTVEP